LLITHPGKVILALKDPNDYAKHLYQRLRELDEGRSKIIIVESIPLGDAWDGIRDRLVRAAGSL
jgi:hypothetical protein